MTDENDNLIFAYTRAQAIEDGVLNDVTELTKAVGILIPTAIACNCWAEAVGSDDPEEFQQRIYELISAVHIEIEKQKDIRSDTLQFAYLIEREGEEPTELDVFVNIGPGDNMEPVLTVMSLLDL